MHGGGFGYFDADGHADPSTGQKVEESATSLTQRLTDGGLMTKVRDDAAGFRTLAVSYCSHDIYAGVISTDPNNPNTTRRRQSPGPRTACSRSRPRCSSCRAPTRRRSSSSTAGARVGRHLRRGVGAAAAGERAGRHHRRREHREPGGVRAANNAGRHCGTGNTDARRWRVIGGGSTRTSRTSTTSPTSSWPTAGSRCRAPHLEPR